MMVRIVALWLFILFSLPLFAQKRVKVTGYIRDAEGNPLELDITKPNELSLLCKQTCA